jgi:hypothetical protein
MKRRTMKSTSQSIRQRSKQQGAVLVISLLLLVVITTLAISGMNTATTELAMARNDQNYEYAFQAAETGLEQAIAQGTFVSTRRPQILLTSPILTTTIRSARQSGSKIRRWCLIALSASASAAASPLITFSPPRKPNQGVRRVVILTAMPARFTRRLFTSSVQSRRHFNSGTESFDENQVFVHRITARPGAARYGGIQNHSARLRSQF